jgi:hypothetical protein
MAFIPYAIDTTSLNYTPNVGQWHSFVAMQPHKAKLMAEGVRFELTRPLQVCQFSRLVP